jgi:hypothetical protein
MAISLSYILYAGVAFVIARILYEFFISPLRRIPGPGLSKFTDAYRAHLTSKGHLDGHMREWHRRWGSAVRVGPNTVSISDPDLIRVIYTTRNPWRKVIPPLSCPVSYRF